ncbi:MAG: helix-turn-helix domain-containing protein [Actinomycetes bacterium]
MQGTVNPQRQWLTALEVQELLNIDRSTVYRMAEDGRLPSIRVGRSWRFPADKITGMLAHDAEPNTKPTSSPEPASTLVGETTRYPANQEPDRRVAQAAIDVAAELLGVMMVVTDMDGQPITDVANPCPWFAEHASDPDVLDQCVAEWKNLADHPDFTPRFRIGAVGFECARTFVRSGAQLVGMVLAGGVSPSDEMTPDAVSNPDLYHLSDSDRARVLDTLPKIAATITTRAPRAAGDQPKETK